jgi:hypothetical protein
MNTQQIILAMVFTSVMGVGLWLRMIVKKAYQIMDGHSISTYSDTMAVLQMPSEKIHKE